MNDSNRLLAAISHAQAFYICNDETDAVYRRLLDCFLDLTESECGMIGQVQWQENGQPYFKAQAITGFAWNEATRPIRQQPAGSEFKCNRLDTLLDAVMTSGKPVIANEPDEDARSADLFPDHPALHTFMGLPIHISSTLVGLVCVANKQQGYGDDLAEFLQPLLHTCGQLINVTASEREWLRMQSKLEAQRDRLESQVAERTAKIAQQARIIEQIHNAVIAADANLTITTWNRGAERMFGYAVEEAVGQPLLTILESQRDQPDFNQLINSLHKAASGEFELQLMRASGETFFAHVSLSVFNNPDVTDTGMIFHVIDISSEKTALDQLEKSESRYRALFELSADAIVLLQGDRYYDCNQAALDIFGYGSKEEFLRETLDDRLTLVQPDGENSRLKALRLLKTCLDTGKTTTVWTFRRASGEEFTGELLLTPIDYCGVRLVQAIIHDDSERRRNEEIIHAHEQYLQTVLDISPIAIMITELGSGAIRFANRRALEFSGLTAFDGEQVTARQFWVDPNERVRLLEQLIREGRASGEATLQNGSGEQFRAMLTCQYNPGSTNEALWWMLDVTAQRATQLKLQQNELMLQQILDHLPVALFVKDINDGFRYVINNRKSAEMFGSFDKTVLGHTDFELSEAEEAIKARREDLEIVRTGQAFECPSQRIEAPTGECLWIRTQKLLIPDIDGKPRLILGMSEDISERVEAEKELKVSEKRFRELAEHAPVGIFLTDARGACLYVNKQWQRMTGLDQEQAAGTGWTTALHEDDAAAVSRAWQNFTEGGPDFAMEYRFVCPDGHLTWVASTAVAFRNDADRVAGFMGSTTDITRRKQFESELEISRDEAERANAAKSAFLSRMSHELRTPLNAVLGFAQLLQMDNKNLTPNQNEGVGHILAGGEHLLHLIEDVLDFSRIDSGRMNLYLQRVSISEILQRSIALVSALAERRNITTILPDTLIADLFADPRRLQQVLVNLLSNAIKYNVMSGTVEVSVARISAYMTRISVKDSGSGIRPDDQERLFEPFERVMDANSTIEGTGIGLSICKKLVEMMGGQIGCDSEFGVGSTFWFDLPDATAAEVPHPFGHHENVPAQMAELDGIRILFMENQLDSIKLLVQVSRNIPGCELFAATNATDGIALAKSSQPDVILLDINLPKVGEFEALAMLRNDERTRNIPVISLSANTWPEMLKGGSEAGMTHCLSDLSRLDTPGSLGNLFQALVAACRPAA